MKANEGGEATAVPSGWMDRARRFVSGAEEGDPSLEFILVLAFSVVPALVAPGLAIRIMREYFLYESIVFTSPFS